MSFPFGPLSPTQMLSRALRRARKRALRRGRVTVEAPKGGRPGWGAEHHFKLETLEPRILMSADPVAGTISLASLSQSYGGIATVLVKADNRIEITLDNAASPAGAHLCERAPDQLAERAQRV